MMSASEYKQRALSFEPPTDRENHVVISGRHTQATQARTVLRQLVESRDRDKSPRVAPRQEAVPSRRRAG